MQQLRTDLAASPLRPPRAAPVAGTAGKQTLNELRALGYLGPGDAQTSTNVPELSSLPDPKDKIEEQNLLHAAMMLADEGRVGEARSSLEKLLTLDADFPAALRQAGELAYRSGEYHAAATYFRHLRKSQPGDTAAALDEAKALDKAGDAQGARRVLDAVVPLTPGLVEARVLLAQVDLKLGDRAAAKDEYEAVLLLQPAQHDALLGLAREHMEQKQFGDVVDLLEPAVNDAADLDLMELLQQAYERLGRINDAARLQKRLRSKSRAARGGLDVPHSSGTRLSGPPSNFYGCDSDFKQAFGGPFKPRLA